MFVNLNLEQYLKGYMLDLEHFGVIEILPQSRQFAAIILHDKRPDVYKPWCVEYRGSGHYFFTRAALDEYCRNREWL